MRTFFTLKYICHIELDVRIFRRNQASTQGDVSYNNGADISPSTSACRLTGISYLKIICGISNPISGMKSSLQIITLSTPLLVFRESSIAFSLRNAGDIIFNWILWSHLTSRQPCWWKEQWWKSLLGIRLGFYSKLELYFLFFGTSMAVLSRQCNQRVDPNSFAVKMKNRFFTTACSWCR